MCTSACPEKSRWTCSQGRTCPLRTAADARGPLPPIADDCYPPDAMPLPIDFAGDEPPITAERAISWTGSVLAGTVAAVAVVSALVLIIRAAGRATGV